MHVVHMGWLFLIAGYYFYTLRLFSGEIVSFFSSCFFVLIQSGSLVLIAVGAEKALGRKGVYLYYLSISILLIINMKSLELTGLNLEIEWFRLLSEKNLAQELNWNYRFFVLILFILIIISFLVIVLCKFLSKFRLSKKVNNFFSLLLVFFLLIAYSWLGLAHIWSGIWQTSYQTSAEAIFLFIPRLLGIQPTRGFKIVDGVDAIELMRVQKHCRPHDSQIFFEKKEQTFKALKAKNMGFKKPSMNLLIIGVESLRYDMISPLYMPLTFRRFYSKSVVFEKHYSVSNSTPVGLFSLLTGEDPRHWLFSYLENREALSWRLFNFLGYKTGAYLGVGLEYMNIQKYIFDLKTEINTPRHMPGFTDDEQMVARLRENIQNDMKPRVDFLWFGRSHFPYHFKNSNLKFKPTLKEESTNLVELSKDQAQLVRNRYNNAIFEIDQNIETLLSKLEKMKYLDKTLVLITGDHGEEFFEDGAIGHSSSLNDWQTRTPLLIWWKGVKAKSVPQATLHTQIMPTIFHLLGYSDLTDIFYGDVSTLFSVNKHEALVLVGAQFASCGYFKRTITP